MAIALSPEIPAPPAPAERGHAASLDDAACRALLARARWGVLAVNSDDGPYAVPVGFAVVNDRVYLASGPGLKREALERDGRACLTVCDVQDGTRWQSVVVRGDVRAVTRTTEQLRAVAAFVARAGVRGAATASRLRASRLFSMSLGGMTGRARG